MRARTSSGRSSSRGTAKRLIGAPLTGLASVGVDTGLLDDRPPLVDLRLQVRGERGGRGLVYRVGLRAEIGEALVDRFVLQRGLQRGDEFVDGRLGRALGRIQAVPDADLEALQ